MYIIKKIPPNKIWMWLTHWQKHAIELYTIWCPPLLHYHEKNFIIINFFFTMYSIQICRMDIFNFECCYAVCVSDQQGGPVVVEIRHFLLDERDLLSEEEECKHTWNTDAGMHMCNFLKHVYQNELQEEQHQWTLTNSSCNQQFAQKQQEVRHSVQNCNPAVTESWISLIWHSTCVISRSGGMPVI